MVYPILMIPGPTNLSDQVLKVMSEPMLGHTSPQFYEEYKEAQVLSSKLFGSDEDKTVLFSGSGTFGMEAGIATFLKEGDRVLSLVNGYFGDRFARIAEIYGIKVKTVSFPDGVAADTDTLRRELQKEKYDAVSMTHIDTSTGVMNDIVSLGNVAKEFGAYVFVDLVSSLGGASFRFNGGPFDYAYSASQKCIAAPPGASLIAISEKLLKRSSEFSPRSYYFNLKMWLNVMKDPKIYLTTPTIPVIRALRIALKELLSEGIETRVRRHEEMGKLAWEFANSRGWSPVSKSPSSTIIAIDLLLPISAAVKEYMLSKKNVLIATGIGSRAGNIIRIGYMGNTDKSLLLNTLKGVEEAVNSVKSGAV